MNNFSKLTIFKFVLLIIFIILVINFTQQSLSIELNEIEYFNEISFDINNPSCLKIKSIKNLESEFNIFKIPKEIYLSNNLKNSFCLGRIVGGFIEEKNITIYYGINQKINKLFLIISILIPIILGIFTNKSLLIKLFLIFQQVIYFYLFNYKTNIFHIFENILFYYALFYITNILLRNEFLHQKTFIEVRDKYNKIIEKNLVNKKVDPKLFFYPSLLTLFFATTYHKLKSKSIFEYFNDELIQIFTSAKMYYYDLTTLSSGINHHSPIIPQIYKFIFYLDDYPNFSIGLILIHSIFALISVLLFSYTLKFLSLKNKTNIIFVFSYFIFLSSNLLLNRILAQFIYILLLICIFSYIKSKKTYKLFLISFLAVLQFYNLEGYLFPLLFILIFLYLNVFENNKELLNTISFTFISFIIIYFPFLLNSELKMLIDTVYIFHLTSTDRVFKFLTLMYSIGNSPEISIRHILILLILGRILYILKNKIIYKKSILDDIYEKLFIYFLLGEFLHLLISGPRSVHYGIVLVLPSLYLLFLYYDKLNFNKNFIFSAVLLVSIFGFFENDINNSIQLFNDNSKIDINKFLDNEDKKIIKNLYKSEVNFSNPELILTWVNAYDWRLIHLELNTLPSTRYWLLLYMKYYQDIVADDISYNWDSFNEEEIGLQFKKEVKLEMPRYAVIDKNMTPPPTFMKEIIVEEFNLVYEGEQFLIYQNKNF